MREDGELPPSLLDRKGKNMNEKWMIQMKKADFTGLSQELHVSPVLVRLMRNRDLLTREEMEGYLHDDMTCLHNPLLMADMKEAVAILSRKIREGKSIRIIGDYDIDGINATYILLTGLTRLGAKADFDIPNRLSDGYGINENLIRKAKDAGVDTILTCDNGIAAQDAVCFAKEAGMTVVVTDHHQVPYEQTAGGRTEILPPADAVIDPHRSDCPYPYKELCGAAVAWKLIQALYDAFALPRAEAEFMIENAAFATVGDVVPLTGENRTIVREGLTRLPHTKNEGMKALLSVCDLRYKPVKAWHIGFVLGPCLNASGRLDTAKKALALLQEKDPLKAQRMAGELKSLNETRKNLTEKGVEAALTRIEQDHMEDDRVLVVYLPQCHESLAGIIAGRLREQYDRPAFVLTDAEKGVKGSGRSVEAYSMYDELSRCRELLTKFGGHPMAAGLSLEKENIGAFRRRLNENCTCSLTELMPPVRIDMELPFRFATEVFTKELALLEPFGKDNPKPLFAMRRVVVSQLTVLGQNRNVCRMRLCDREGTVITGIRFGDAETFFEAVQDAESGIDITYYPDVNEFRGRKTMQAIIENWRISLKKQEA